MYFHIGQLSFYYKETNLGVAIKKSRRQYYEKIINKTILYE